MFYHEDIIWTKGVLFYAKESFVFGYAYVITCKNGTPLDGTDADFQSMIDSFTLK
ncbi:MAG: hypothetical protein FWC60_04385 [Firmicutes bacterium]|nr:hypothetical protein [Bacillota bacterium]